LEIEVQEVPEVKSVCRVCKAFLVLSDRKENGDGEGLEANRD